MRKYLFLLIVPILTIFSCVDDTSSYVSQEKENVDVEGTTPNGGEEEPPVDGELTPGVHLVKLNVTQPDGQVVERRFKYFMPSTLVTSKPISLIFEFHGSYEFEKDELPSDPIDGITKTNALCQLASRENCIVCFPAGEVVVSSDGSGAVNWQNSENHLPFVDAMLDFFKTSSPSVDPKRIYSTGQSSGAIFSFELAFYRSGDFAAITPRAGQMSIENQTDLPSRAVPVRVFAGEIDDIVQHSAVLKNMEQWAIRIGGYFPGDMVLKEAAFESEDYKTVDTRTYHGGNADLEIYTLKEEGHGINVVRCTTLMWEFMAAHPMEQETVNCFVTSETKEVVAQCGEKVEIGINYTEGAELTITGEPKGWNFRLENKTIKMVGPTNFFADIDRKGNMILTVTIAGQTAKDTISYELTAPKEYFEVGDIYYNEDFEPVGVVCWVNNANIKEAKIINIDVMKSTWYCGSGTGLGISFSTPNFADGEANTRAMVDFNATLSTPYTASNAAFMWAATYTYKGVSGWYLPAIDELESMAPNLEKVNEVITSLGGAIVAPSWGELKLYSSTTEVKNGASTKTIYVYNFDQNSIIADMAKSDGSEYFGYINVRAFKKVTK